jgi:hypothetical protein
MSNVTPTHEARSKLVESSKQRSPAAYFFLPATVFGLPCRLVVD